jgi:drug/metabolite transporter (DMT)-like permease
MGTLFLGGATLRRAPFNARPHLKEGQGAAFEDNGGRKSSERFNGKTQLRIRKAPARAGEEAEKGSEEDAENRIDALGFVREHGTGAQAAPGARAILSGRGREAAVSGDSLGTHLLSSAFVFIWATGFIVAGLAAPHADPFTFLSGRHALSILVFVIASALAGAAWPRDWPSWRDALIAGMLLHGLYIGGVFWSIWHGVPAGVTALVTGLHPLLTAALAIPLLHERVSARQWAGIAVGFAGVGLVVAPALGAVKAVPIWPMLVALGATAALSLGTVWQKYSKPRMDLRANAAIQFMGALLFVAPLALFLEDGRFDHSRAVWGALLWAVFVISVGAISLLLVLLKRGAASRVAPLLYIAPPVAAVIAYVLFGETLTPVQIAGAVLAIAGAFIARQ